MKVIGISIFGIFILYHGIIQLAGVYLVDKSPELGMFMGKGRVVFSNKTYKVPINFFVRKIHPLPVQADGSTDWEAPAPTEIIRQFKAKIPRHFFAYRKSLQKRRAKLGLHGVRQFHFCYPKIDLEFRCRIEMSSKTKRIGEYQMISVQGFRRGLAPVRSSMELEYERFKNNTPSGYKNVDSELAGYIKYMSERERTNRKKNDLGKYEIGKMLVYQHRYFKLNSSGQLVKYITCFANLKKYNPFKTCKAKVYLEGEDLMISYSFNAAHISNKSYQKFEGFIVNTVLSWLEKTEHKTKSKT